jgi:methyltransferase (TIGR00027 family)
MVPDDSRPASHSGTAYWIAAARARESERADRLFDDPYARVLAGAGGRAALAASEDVSGGENEFLPIRTRFFDDVLLDEADRLDQVVLLGAGFDTRAFRLTLPAQLRWFEIDRAEIFEHKERVLGELGAVARCGRTTVSADLTGAWSKPLLDAGFEVGSRTVWIAEGLLFYLSRETGEGVLAETRMLSGDGSMMAADVFGSGLLTLPAMQPYIAAQAQRGLPPPFTTDDPVATFRSAGWQFVHLTSPGQLSVTYRRAIERAKQPPASPHPTMQSYLVVARGED